jgi:signal transduction histidine kinase/DNA-binding response OmpR family regulator
MSLDIDRMPLVREQDLVIARQKAREIAERLGFDRQDQSRIATAVSEIARNAIRYARDGSIAYEIEGERAPQILLIRIADRGPGIPNLDEILRGRYRSTTGMGLGIVGARRLMDRCEITSSPGGTTVVMTKLFDSHAASVRASDVERIRAAIRGQRDVPMDELQHQQHELLLALADARDRQEELTRLNRELEDTNRGVVALYAELDEQADHLRRADEMKSRFLSNMSHEFRTPLNSIRALSGLLLERVDGPLADEQERQVTLIRKATDDLSNLVEDLLDLARIEAGRLEIHAAEFAIDDLFSALRGMLRPLLVGESVALRFEPPVGAPSVYADEAKVSQILRNFISNALKFTEAGSVTVSASCVDDTVVFCVADTGIGIAPDDQQRIFEEFVQVRSRLQARVKGTGLGLPLCRRLAHALGGEVSVESVIGAGSKFFLRLPIRYADVVEPAVQTAPPAVPEPWHIPVLVVEDERDMHLFYEKSLRDTPFRTIAAHTLHQASAAVERARPAAVILDILLRNEDAWRWLAEFKASPDLQSIPVLVVTTVNEQRKAFALGADAFAQKPIDRAELVALLNQATASRVLIVDDDATTRYAMRKLLDRSPFLVLEAATGEDGLRVAEIANPRTIVLDLGLPDVNGFALLTRLKASPVTRGIPVIVATAHDLTDAERVTLEAQAFAVLSKRDMLGTIVANVAAAASSASSSLSADTP